MASPILALACDQQFQKVNHLFVLRNRIPTAMLSEPIGCTTRSRTSIALYMTRRDATRRDATRRDATRRDTIRYGMICYYDIVSCDVTCCVVMRCDAT